MAYTYSATSVTTAADFFAAINTALLAQGWTVVDTISGSHKVYRSANLLGIAGFYTFVSVDTSGATFLVMNAMQDYDASTHTVINGGAITQGIVIEACTLYVRCNPYSLAAASVGGSFPSLTYLGGYRSYAVPHGVAGSSGGFTLTTAGMSMGATSVTVQNDMTADLYVGQVVAIQNFKHDSTSGNKTNKEIVTITSISAGTIGFSGGTANAYDSGAKIGRPEVMTTLSGERASGGSAPTVIASAFFTSLDQTQAPSDINLATQQYTGQTSTQVQSLTLGEVHAEPPHISSNVSADQGIWGLAHHLLFGYPETTGSPPVAGHKYTDGTDVYVQLCITVTAGPVQLMGPTGDAPNFSTQRRLRYVAPPGGNDTLLVYTAPPAQAHAPTNMLNQGLN